MTKTEIAIAALLAIIAAELGEYVEWLAKKLVRTAAHLRYGDIERAQMRAEEWTTVIEDRPGQVLKMGTALALFVAGACAAGKRRVREARPHARKWLVRLAVIGSATAGVSAVAGIVAIFGWTGLAEGLGVILWGAGFLPEGRRVRALKWSVARQRARR
ncbi:hypothetical protein ACPCHT_32045 [Nucisporomicrobium flavum]|uniref:hypothetical protein n=1 Tax=Nucisporomicrobium flavum TaxID=2785915 RepID=UPI003C2E4A9B